MKRIFKTIFIIGIPLAFSSLIGFATLTDGHDWGDDFASYIMQAQSILDGRMEDFIKTNRFTIQESSYIIGPEAYPWGFPLLLAPIIAMRDSDFLAPKYLNLVCFVLFLICLYPLVSKRLPKRDSLLILLLFAFNPAFILYLDYIMSDMPFLFFSTLGILLIDRWILLNERPQISVSAGVLIAMIIFCASFIRRNGFFLLPALLLSQAIFVWRMRSTAGGRQRREALKLATPWLTFGILWNLSAAVFPGGEESHAVLLGMSSPTIVLKNALYYLVLPADFFSGAPYPLLLYWAMLPFVGFGIYADWRKSGHFLLYSLLTLVAFVFWPMLQGMRFILPILPFYIYYAFQGMRLVNNHCSGLFAVVAKWTAAGCWCLIAIAFAASSVGIARDNLARQREIEGPFDPASTQMFDFVRKHTELDSVVIFFKPRVMRMITARKAIMITQCRDMIKGDYYVYHKRMDGFNQTPTRQLIECNPPMKLATLFDNDMFTVYKLIVPN